MTRRRIGLILLLAGSAALLWCLTVLAGAALFNWYQSRRLDRAHLRHEHGAVSVLPRPAPKLHDVVGRLEIPRLHVSAIVLEGDDESTLRYGAGHVPGTALPGQAGNMAIAGHRDTFFRPLRRIHPKDRVAFTTPDGSYDYTVESTEIVGPDDVRVLNASHSPELTLITCYPFTYIGEAPERFIVHARRGG
jgi:sortase A